MIPNFRFCLWILAYALAGTASFSATALTLAEAQQRLFERNVDLVSTQVDIGRAQSQWQESRSTLWPSLDLSGNYTVLSEKNHLELTLPQPLPNGTVVSRDLGDFDRWETGVDLSYPLFTGFAREHQIEARRQTISAQQTRQQAIRNQVSLRLASLYYAWQASKAGLDFQEAQCKWAAEQITVAEAQKKQGLANDRLVLAARSKWLGNLNDQLIVANQVDSLAWEAAQLLNDRGGILWSQDTVTSKLPDTLTEDQYTGIENARPELQSLAHQGEALQASEQALQGQKWPTLAAMAGLRYANPGLNLAGTEPMGYGLAGLQVKWNLFDGGKHRSQATELRQRREQLALEASRLQGDWNKSIALAARQYHRWHSQNRAAQGALDAAERSLLDVRRQLAQGLVTPVDTLETKTQVERARMLRQQSLAMLKLVHCQWLYAHGDTLNFSR